MPTLFRRLPLASLLLPLVAAPVAAQEFEIFTISEDFTVQPDGYVLTPLASANATASLQLDEVNSEARLVFRGTWDVPAGGSEDAYGFLDPEVTFDPSSYQLDPATSDDIAGVTFSIDAEVLNGNFDPGDGIFLILRVAQRNPDGSNTLYGYGTLIQSNTQEQIDVVLSAADFNAFGAPVPDFSRAGMPISFGLQLGATYRETTGNAPVAVSGTLTADNWELSVLGMPLFADGFGDGAP